MTQLNDKVDTKKLKTAYSSNPVYKAAFDHLAAREKNSSETKVERLQWVLEQESTTASRADIIEYFRLLESAGCGEFLVGRKGHSSRFRWDVSLVSVGRAAAGEVKEVEALTEADRLASSEEEIDDSRIEHRFVLRPDLEVRIVLPADLSEREACRLADFMKTLPFSHATAASA